MTQIPVFVINLDRAAQRLERMDAELGALGVSYERLPAVDGSAITADFIKTFAPVKSWRQRRRPAPSQVGCYLSHVRALELIRDRGLERACILEDDVVFAPDFPSFLDAAAPWPDGTDVLKLEIAGVADKLRALVIGRTGSRKFAFIQSGGQFGAAAYIVTASGAEKMLADLKVMTAGYDGQAFDYYRSGVKVVHVMPPPCVQLNGEGENAPHSQKAALTPIAKVLHRASRIAVNALKLRYRIAHFGLKRSQRLQAYEIIGWRQYNLAPTERET